MKSTKFFTLLVVLLFVLAACGAPEAAEPLPPEIIIEEVEVIVEVPVEVEKIVEVPGETVYIEVAPTLAPTPEFVDSGLLYLTVNQHTVLWELVGETADGLPIFERFQPLMHFAEGDIVLAYSGHGPDEYYRIDGGLAMAGPSFPNAQGFVCTDEWVMPIWVYDDPDNICSGPATRTALFPGRWVGQWIDVDGNLRGETYFYKFASDGKNKLLDGPGLFILADRVDMLSCEALDFPASCNQ